MEDVRARSVGLASVDRGGVCCVGVGVWDGSCSGAKVGKLEGIGDDDRYGHGLLDSLPKSRIVKGWNRT